MICEKHKHKLLFMWVEERLVRQYPTTNLAWHIGRHQDIGYERYLVLDENNLHEAKDPWDRVMLP